MDKKWTHECLGLGLLMMALSTSASLAHEGHGTHGAVPAGLHRGKVQEAKQVGASADAKQVYFEVRVADGKINVFPLSLKDESSFEDIDLSKVTLVETSVEYPRSKQNVRLQNKAGKDGIEASFSPKQGQRFIVHISAAHGGVMYKAQVQFEGK